MYNNLKKYCFDLVPSFTEEDWSVMRKLLTIRRIAKGGLIFKQGDIANTVSYINYGLVRIFVATEDKNISIGFLGTNFYISPYESFLMREPSTEAFEALEDTELFELSYDAVHYLYEHLPISQIFGRKIAEQLFIFISQRSNALLLLTPEQRYLAMIANGDPILQQVPQYMLASFIGVTPEHLSRIRKKMAS